MSQYHFYSQNKSKHTLLLASFFLIVVSLFFAYLTKYSNYIVYPMWAIWIPTVLFSSNALTKNDHTFIVVSLLLLIMELLYWIIGVSSTETGQILRDTNWIMAGLVSIYLMQLFSSRELSMVYSILVLALLLLMLLITIDGRAILAIEGQDEAATVASAWYGSLFMLLSGLSLIVFLHVKKNGIRVVSLFVLTLTIYLNLVILQRGTNVIFTFAELSLILIFVLKRRPLVISLSVIIIAFVVYILASDSLTVFFDWLARVSPSERLSVRFSEISMAITYADIEGTTGSFAGRNELIGNSWNTFTSSVWHFVFGAGEHLRDHSIIGHHSFIVDTLARYGIIGGALLFVYLQKQYQIVMSVLNKKKEWALYMQCAVVFVFYFLRSFYGDMAFSVINFVVLLFFPLTFQLIHIYNNKKSLIVK